MGHGKETSPRKRGEVGRHRNCVFADCRPHSRLHADLRLGAGDRHFSRETSARCGAGAGGGGSGSRQDAVRAAGRGVVFLPSRARARAHLYQRHRSRARDRREHARHAVRLDPVERRHWPALFHRGEVRESGNGRAAFFRPLEARPRQRGDGQGPRLGACCPHVVHAHPRFPGRQDLCAHRAPQDARSRESERDREKLAGERPEIADPRARGPRARPLCSGRRLSPAGSGAAARRDDDQGAHRAGEKALRFLVTFGPARLLEYYHPMSDTTDYEKRLRARLQLLRQKLEQGQITLPSNRNIRDSLNAVRYGTDGEIDLSTVNSLVKSLALAVEAADSREKTRSVIELKELQSGYFSIIEEFFGHIYSEMKRAEVTPYEIAADIAGRPELVKSISGLIPEFVEWNTRLWENAHDTAQIHAEELPGLKAAFGGEIFPQGRKNIASSSGIYVDTIILPDPFVRSKVFLTEESDEQKVGWLIRNALSLLNYRELALAETEQPIVIIVPDSLPFDDDYNEVVVSKSDLDLKIHLQKVFGKNFADLDQAKAFLEKLHSPEEVLAAAAEKSRILFDLDDPAPLEKQIEKHLNLSLNKRRGIVTAGSAVFGAALGRMRQANDLLARSQRLRASPLIDAPTSWKFFNWTLEYGAEQLDRSAAVNLHMAKALQSAAEGEMAWLGNIPPAALIEIRKTGALPELRQVLSSGIADLVELRSDNFFRTGDKVVDNIRAAFDAHAKKLDDLRGKKWRFAGIELGSCIVKGSLEVASAVGIPGASLVRAALDEAIDIPKIKELPKKARALRDEGKTLKSSPVGLLFQQSKK